MGSSFRIRQGGQIRKTFPLVSGFTAFNKGQVLEIDADGYANEGAGNASGVVHGVAIEDSPSTSSPGSISGSTTTRSTQPPSGLNTSVLLDQAEIETDELSSGAVFAAGDLVYQDSAGKFTNSNSVNKVLGTALGRAVANAGETLTMLFAPQL